MSKTINENFLKIIDNLNRNNDKKNLKILDWGCGKGELVKFLNLKGYNCYGLEIESNNKVKNHLDLLKNDFIKDKISYINDNNKTEFASDYFDVVITNQVIEHMSNKDKFIYELKRILKSGGYSYNILPAKFRIIEVHLKMPFIHWFPKNIFRKYLISFFNIFKLRHWLECKNLSFNQQVNYYYDYSIKKTFYLSANDLFKRFKMNGFYVNDSYLKNKILNNIFIRFIKNNFISIEFLATKSDD